MADHCSLFIHLLHSVVGAATAQPKIEPQKRRRKMKYIIYLICCSAVILSCNKKAVIGDKFMTLSYKQTHCSDLWITNPTNDNITVNNISHFLDSAGMTSPEFGVNIRNDGVAEICSACTCKTGKNIYVTVLYSAVLLSKYQSFGFTRIQ